MISLDSYRKAIALDEPFGSTTSLQGLDKEKVIDEILIGLSGSSHNTAAAYADKRKQLQSLLTIRSPELIVSESIHSLIDLLLQEELLHKTITDVKAIPVLSESDPESSYTIAASVAIWIGDITTLKADAIVNAANAQMLGCFQPFHKCIDNAIHNAAGPRVREDCYQMMQLQGKQEDTGLAKVTRGYNLPSKFVLHTVGPIVHSKIPESHHRELLSSSYRSCLDLAKETGLIKSVVFCSISTGVFGYPIEEAAVVALHTVNEWMKANPGVMDVVVFNVFSDRDEAIYKAVLKQWK